MSAVREVADQDPAEEVTEGVPERSGPRIYGVIDVIRPDRIAGWAIDRTDSAAVLEVDVLREGRVVRTVLADRHRGDLEKGGIGTGRYGFRAEIEPPLDPGFEFTLAAIARAPDGAQGALKPVGAAARSPEAGARLLERIFEEVVRPAPVPAAAPQRPGAEIERLEAAIGRIELAQARLEAALCAAETPHAARPEGGLRWIVAGALAVGLVSLGMGIYSLFAG